MYNRMLKNVFSLMLILCSAFFVIPTAAQNELDKGNLLLGDMHDKDSRISRIIADDKNGIYTYGVAKKTGYSWRIKPIISFYDRSLKLQKTNEVTLKNGKKKLLFLDIFELGDEIYIFSTNRNNKMKKSWLYAQTINKETLQLNDDLIELAEIDFAEFYPKLEGKFSISKAEDGSNFLVQKSLKGSFINPNTGKPKHKDKTQWRVLQVFDEELELMWQNESTSDDPTNTFRIMNACLDEKGNLHFLGQRKAYNIDKNLKNGDTHSALEIMSYTEQGTKIETYPVRIDNLNITDLKLAVDENYDFICVGFYSRTVAMKRIAGSFYLRIDAETGEHKKEVINEFGEELVLANRTKDEKKQFSSASKKINNYGLERFVIRELDWREDGSIILVAERSYNMELNALGELLGEVSFTIGVKHDPWPRDYYHTERVRFESSHKEDILVINFSEKGEVLWESKIGKRQEAGEAISSFAMTEVENGSLRFIFNDHPDNRLASTGEYKWKVFRGQKKSVTTMVTLNKDGLQKRDVLFSFEKDGLFLNSEVNKQLSDQEFLILTESEGVQRLAKICY